ncbi:MAG: hypothetical protein ACK5N8_04540 [Alphaproteobacteria bacterium]
MKRDLFLRRLIGKSNLPPINSIVFESSVPGTYSVFVKQGIYLLEISGGGGKSGKASKTSKSMFSGGGGGGGAAFKGQIKIETARTLSMIVGKGGTSSGPTINGYNIGGSDGEWGGASQISGIVVCNGGRGGMFGAVRNNVAPGGTYNFIMPEIIISKIIGAAGNNGGPGDMNAPAKGANSKLTETGGGIPHGGHGTKPGAGGAGTTASESFGGNGANGIIKLTFVGKINI